MKSKLYLSAIALAAMALFSGCAKDGAVGPQGPQGTQGPAGYDGNANVIGTNSVTVTWTQSGSSWTASVSAGGITQDIVDKGSVQVFILYGSEWWAMPDVNGINSTVFGFGLGYISFINSNSDNSLPPFPAHSTFRVVIISASQRLANPNVNWKSYTEVKSALHLQD